MADSLSGAIIIPPCVSCKPRKSISVTSNRHLEGFRNREFSCRTFEEVLGNLPVEVKFAYPCKDTTVVHIVLELGPISIVEGPEHMVHEFLHYSGTVSGSKWHYSGHVEPIRSFECQNVLRLFFDRDVIVAFMQVELAEEDHSNCVFEYRSDSGQGADIFDRYRIDLPVVE